MTQREKNIKKQNNKGSSPARGTMLKPFFLLLLFLCPEAEHTETSFLLDNLTLLNFHVPIKFEIFTESIALILTVTNYCIWQTRKKQLNSDSPQLETVKPSNVLAMIFNHIKIREKKESLQTDKTNYEIIKNIRLEVGRELHNLFE